MEALHWELHVLEKAIAHKNLSSAAQPVGLSQPQLSRIISRIEKEFNVTLLDRTTKRKSGWLPIAFELVKIYSKHNHKLQTDLMSTIEGAIPKYLRIACLEGLGPYTSKICHSLLKQSHTLTVELDVYDLFELEELFLKGNADLIFTEREPGKKKYLHQKAIGYQTIDSQNLTSKLKALSPFEYSKLSVKEKNHQENRFFITNSLSLKKQWVDNFGAQAKLPSPITKKISSQKEAKTVYLIGQDTLHPKIWENVVLLVNK